MPLWDATFAQVQALATASAFDGANDTFPIYDDSAGYIGKAALQEARPLENWVFMLSGSEAATASASTTAAKTTQVWPYDFTVTEILLTANGVVTSGTMGADVMKDNGSSVTSILDNTTTPSTTAITLTSSDNGGKYKSASPHASQTTIAAGDEIECYATATATGGTGARIVIVGYRT